jgi:glycogen debranching enzyme
MKMPDGARVKELLENAKEILRGNDLGKFTIPSGQLYPHMWAWDSAFAAMGWAHIDIKRAQDEIEYLLSTAWENGMIPHITFDQSHLKDYFPGPDVWGHPKGSTISQPPVWAQALEYLLEKGADQQWAKSMLPAIEKSHLFFKNERDPQHKNLLAIAHPWESGMDNCVAWDQPMEAISTDIRNELNRVDTKKVEDTSQRPSDKEYYRYLKIVEELQDHDFKSRIFQTYDPMMSTILCLNEFALARLQEKFGLDNLEAKTRAENIKSSLLDMKNADGYFQYHDAVADKTMDVKSLGALYPYLLTGDCPPELLSAHKIEHGLSTQNTKDQYFDPKCYWRGPCWINTNWFFSKIDKNLEQDIFNLIDKSGFREYYHPETGEGLGAHKFSWSAALFLVTFDK